jgi:hypothetical protein
MHPATRNCAEGDAVEPRGVLDVVSDQNITGKD